MARVVSRKRRNVEVQGFNCLTNDEVEGLDVWLRLTPAVTLVIFAVGVSTASWKVLAILCVTTFSGALLTGHPLDVFYNHGIRYLTSTAEIPPFQKPRRLAFLVETLQIGGCALAFGIGANVVGFTLGVISIGAGLVYIATGVCGVSIISMWIFGDTIDPCPEPAGADGERKFESVSPLWPKS
jgi:hypothetical protein